MAHGGKRPGAGRKLGGQNDQQTGERSAGNPHAAFDAAGAGNVAWSRCCDTRNRKGEATGNTIRRTGLGTVIGKPHETQEAHLVAIVLPIWPTGFALLVASREARTAS